MADGSGPVLQRLIRAHDPEEQKALRENLPSDDSGLRHLLLAYLDNPFLRLTDDEAMALSVRASPAGLRGVIASRHMATNSATPRYVVFCMPKSGSSFVKSAICHALQLPLASLTCFGALSSHFGMNAREQEIDELALVKSIHALPNGFVAQHHTRYTQYLGLQMAAFRLTPVVTVRNILDCLVSFDDMMLEWRDGLPSKQAWVSDPYALPRDYPERPPEARYAVLAPSLGVWLIQFFLSWKRGWGQKLLTPLVLQYERDVLDPARFVERVADALDFSDDQRTRLAAYAAAPDRQKSRLNVGQAGRGREKVSPQTRRFLRDYAETFSDELSPAEIGYLLD